MGLLDALFGRGRLPKPKTDPLFSLATAELTIRVDLGWEPAGRAGVCLKPVASSDFSQAYSELKELISVATGETKSELEVVTDDYNYRWLLFSDKDMEDLVSLIHVTGETLVDSGYGEQLLSGVFKFVKPVENAPETAHQQLYLIYSYKRGCFYPFVPLSDKQKTRDTASELSIANILSRELPTEKDISRWYPIWNCPV